MHEYERTATIPGQRTYILRKLKRKYGKVEVSCIESGQSNQYLLPNSGNYIANNGIQAQAARCHTYELDPNQILAELKVINGHEGFEYQSTESWNSHLVGDFPKNQRSHLPFNSGNHIAGKATPNLLMRYLKINQAPMKKAYNFGTWLLLMKETIKVNWLLRMMDRECLLIPKLVLQRIQSE
ncbi:hypothetical protein ERO13_D07G137950v2 [Gossypium hirsutum]|uniref:Uncharacterized protein n=1 Tax=Gossypium hirsutum TaxID=3635 RepID=A0A1U8P2V7_GOSHI|nr:uncharacterized protein LOC107954415 [Gossypium hirsutum]KAG4138501.1 hypothetical protein ERO13_D07G137950v2 [Gossypium hirsutum]KAG4138502.1 hypothetical protein ERO13_D07G137950v2 [Gossypium hirsutum]